MNKVILTGFLLLFFCSFLFAYDYIDAIEKGIWFFDANKCGPDAAVDNVFGWRGACHTGDSAGGVNLTGGYHDAGDHVKFGLPEAYMAGTLGWTLYEYREMFDAKGLTPKLLSTIKYATDYFLRSHPNPDTFYYQVGDGNQDHGYWGPPENQGGRSALAPATPANSCSDVTAATAAALAIMSLNYRSTDLNYATQCLQAAQSLYTLAMYNTSRSHDGGGGAFYPTSSHYDDLAWGGVWLSIATGESSYIDPVEGWMDNQQNDIGEDNYLKPWAPAWGDYAHFVILKMAHLTKLPKFVNSVKNQLEWYLANVSRSPGGLPVLNNWGNLRYASAEAGYGFLAYKLLSYDGYLQQGNKTMDYILGDNPRGGSYLSNYLSNSPQHPHHRANEPGGGVNHHVVGALVGGPDSSDQYQDDIGNFYTNEVTIDYNASFVFGMAGRAWVAGGSTPGPTLTPGPTATPGTPSPTIAPNTNIALNKSVSASSYESSQYSPGNAVDGNAATRWASAFSEPQTITVDLGRTYAVNRIVLKWEAAAASQYKVQISEDNSSWSNLVNITNGDGGIDEHTVSATGRYVRMEGVRRTTEYGFSLFEFEIYGVIPSTPEPTPTPTLEPSTLGDVNSDGVVNIIDALLVAQEYVGLNPSNINRSNADVNCDGAVNILDALLIAQYYVSLIDQFPCIRTPGPTPTAIIITPTPSPTITGEPDAVPGSQTDVSSAYFKMGDIRLINNDWGSQALGCNSDYTIFINNDRTFGWNFSRGSCGDGGTKPDYPEIEFGIHPFGVSKHLVTSPDSSSTSILPLQIKDILSASVEVDNLNIQVNSANSWNMNFEMWFTTEHPVTGQHTNAYAELMLFWGWNDGRWPCDKSGGVQAGDHYYNLCHQSDNWGGWRYYQFRVSGGPWRNYSGRVDIKALLEWLVNNAGFSRDLWVSRFEIGSEIGDNTSGRVSMNSVTFEVNGQYRSPEFGQY